MTERGFTLANRDHLGLVMMLLLESGSMCPCGSGTRVTSKRWAKCKKCGTRVQRRSMEDAREVVRVKLMEPAEPVEATAHE